MDSTPPYDAVFFLYAYSKLAVCRVHCLLSSSLLRYTSQLDKSKLSAEQIAAAERMAAEIERESRSKVKSTNMGGLGGYRPEPAASYADSQTASFLNKQKATLPPQSARPQPPAAPQQAKVTPPQQQFLNECKVRQTLPRVRLYAGRYSCKVQCACSWGCV
jgi:hypothetical protein